MTDKEVEERIASAVALGIEKQRAKDRADHDARNKKANRLAFWALIAIVAVAICLWGWAASYTHIPAQADAIALCESSLGGYGVDVRLSHSGVLYQSRGVYNQRKEELASLSASGADGSKISCTLSKSHVYHLSYLSADSDDSPTVFVDEDISGFKDH